MRNHLHIGDVRAWAKTLPPQSVQTIVTSPPYFGLRSYLDADHPDKAHEMGSEPTPSAFVAALVDLFRDLQTALRDDGTLWLNLGDTYVANRGNTPEKPGHDNKAVHSTLAIRQFDIPGKPKDLIGIPWRVALALQADGWYLRSDIIWHKPNPMPESVTDRPTRSHEHIFLLSKRPTYYYDAAAIAEQSIHAGKVVSLGEKSLSRGQAQGASVAASGNGRHESVTVTATRNKRDVWTVPSAAFPGSHFATFPPDLIRPCILAGTSEKGACAACGAPWRRVVERESASKDNPRAWQGVPEWQTNRDHRQEPKKIGAVGTPSVTHLGWAPSCTCNTTETRPCIVADPFAGSGTTMQVCVEEGRDWLGCDLDDRARGWLAERLAALPVARLAGC